MHFEHFEHIVISNTSKHTPVPLFTLFMFIKYLAMLQAFNYNMRFSVYLSTCYVRNLGVYHWPRLWATSNINDILWRTLGYTHPISKWHFVTFYPNIRKIFNHAVEVYLSESTDKSKRDSHIMFMTIMKSWFDHLMIHKYVIVAIDQPKSWTSYCQ